MARSSGGFPDHLLFITRSFLGGCFATLGICSGLVIALVLAFGVFPTQFLALVRLSPIRVVSRVPTVCPTALAEIQPIELFLTIENQPGAPRVVEAKVPLEQPLFICARGPQGAAIEFSIRIVGPTGTVIPFDGTFITDPSGKPFCLGPLIGLPNTPGVYRIDALVGTTIVGSTVLTLAP